MDSASQPEPPSETPHSEKAHSETPHSRVSSFLGVLIAVITVTLPLFAIARFSSEVEAFSVPSYSLPRAQ
ncbi:MAG: hypothetical protein AAGF01_28485 [Cyanobacteria bacterium P01_G01_bin.38]